VTAASGTQGYGENAAALAVAAAEPASELRRG
jgi:hypothetical protein